VVLSTISGYIAAQKQHFCLSIMSRVTGILKISLVFLGCLVCFSAESDSCGRKPAEAIFPWVVLLQNNETVEGCSRVLIDKKHVVTSTECFSRMLMSEQNSTKDIHVRVPPLYTENVASVTGYGLYPNCSSLKNPTGFAMLVLKNQVEQEPICWEAPRIPSPDAVPQEELWSSAVILDRNQSIASQTRCTEARMHKRTVTGLQPHCVVVPVMSQESDKWFFQALYVATQDCEQSAAVSCVQSNPAIFEWGKSVLAGALCEPPREAVVAGDTTT